MKIMHTQTRHTTSQPNSRIQLHWLDWLRFIAALLVVVSHARGGLWVDWGRLAEASKTIPAAFLFAVTRVGAESVLVFFVLSGFLVGGKLIERLGANTFNLRTYLIDRFTRIWIPLIPALLWSTTVAYQVGKPLVLLDLLGNLVGLQGVLVMSYAANYPLWSLAYEIWFYFLGGSVAVWIGSTDQNQRIFAGLALAIGLAIFTKLVIIFLFAWILGASTYWLIYKPKNKFLAMLGGVLVIAGYVICQLRSATVSLDTSHWLQYIPSSAIGMLAYSFGIALVLPFLIQLAPKSKLGKIIDAIGGNLAAFSYTLYLTHYPVLYLWEHFMPGRYEMIGLDSMLWFGLRIVSCIFFGWVFYLPFEKQTTRVRSWLSLQPYREYPSAVRKNI